MQHKSPSFICFLRCHCFLVCGLVALRPGIRLQSRIQGRENMAWTMDCHFTNFQFLGWLFSWILFVRNYSPVMRSYVKCVSTGSFFMPVKAPLNSFTHCYAELRFCRSFERLSEQRAPFRRMQHPWTDPSSPCVTEIWEYYCCFSFMHQVFLNVF